MREAKDYTGLTFGENFIIIGPDEENNKKSSKKKWLRKCLKCGQVISVRTDYLTKPQSCRCIRKERELEESKKIIGKTFGYLTVIGLSKEKSGKSHLWECKCNLCGNITTATSTALKNGNKKSCGCYQKIKAREIAIPLDDLSGKVFGKLRVISQNFSYKKDHNLSSDSTYWNCICENCGNETIVSRGNLIRGRTKTCGKCKHIPLGELKIKEILENNKIKYSQQYSFPDLKGKRNFLKFDFAIFKDEKIEYLIEFQGEQHYTPIDFFGGEDSFNKQKEFDQIKREYCKKRGIALIEIPYYHYNNLSIQDLIPETSQFLYKGVIKNDL